MSRNSMLLGERMDNVEQFITYAQLGELYGMIQVQSLLESMKEIYGWLLLIAILCLLGLMIRYSGIRPVRMIEPTYRTIHNFIRMEIKSRLLHRKRSRELEHLK